MQDIYVKAKYLARARLHSIMQHARARLHSIMQHEIFTQLIIALIAMPQIKVIIMMASMCFTKVCP